MISPIRTSIPTSISPSLHTPPAVTFSASSPSSSRISNPSTVAKAIYNQVLVEKSSQSPSIQPKSNSRTRQQRKFGEVVTTDVFLNEIKEKIIKKLAKPKRQNKNIVQNKVPLRKSTRIQKKTK